MVIRTIDSAMTAAPALCDFMGADLVRRLSSGAGHPLGRGTRFVCKPEEMESVADLVSLCELEVAATAILTHLIGKGSDDRVWQDLRSANRCRALLFEAIVLSELIEPYVGSVIWRRYETAASDLVADNPRLQIECTLMGQYSFPVMMKKAEAKLPQRRENEGPYVVVVGTEMARRIHIMNDMTQAPRTKLDSWMGSHPAAAAFHFVAPRALSDDERVRQIGADEYSLQVSRFFGVTVRNRVALDPLPAAFEMNWVNPQAP